MFSCRQPVHIHSTAVIFACQPYQCVMSPSTQRIKGPGAPTSLMRLHLPQLHPPGVYGTLAGGETLTISGSNFAPTFGTLFCRFGPNENAPLVPADFESVRRVSCQVPPATEPATVELFVTTNGIDFGGGERYPVRAAQTTSMRQA
eukprot:4055500-Pleurochrysis_carterae.AAC.5